MNCTIFDDLALSDLHFEPDHPKIFRLFAAGENLSPCKICFRNESADIWGELPACMRNDAFFIRFSLRFLQFKKVCAGVKKTQNGERLKPFCVEAEKREM